MTIIRRSAAAAGLVLAVLGLVTCLAGAAGTWAVKTRAQDAAAAVFTTVDDALEFIGTRVGRVKERLDAARPRVTGLSALAGRLQSIELEADLKALADSLRERLDSAAIALKDAEGRLDPIEAVARGVQSLAASAAASDDLAEPEKGVRSVRAATVAEFAGELAKAASRLEALRVRLLEIRENRLLAREFAVACLAEVADLDTRLANLIKRIDEFAVRVSDARVSSADQGRRVHRWIGLGALALAAILVWFAASQVCVMQRAWRGLRPLLGPAESASKPKVSV
jgi:hypothetical protein